MNRLTVQTVACLRTALRPAHPVHSVSKGGCRTCRKHYCEVVRVVHFGCCGCGCEHQRACRRRCPRGRGGNKSSEGLRVCPALRRAAVSRANRGRQARRRQAAPPPPRVSPGAQRPRMYPRDCTSMCRRFDLALNDPAVQFPPPASAHMLPALGSHERGRRPRPLPRCPTSTTLAPSS